MAGLIRFKTRFPKSFTRSAVFSSRPTERTISKSDPLLKQNYVAEPAWKASTLFLARIGTMNRLVLVLEDRLSNRWRGRARRRGRNGGSWRAPFRFSECIGTM